MRTTEEFALFNPAFLGYMINRAAYGWEKTQRRGMPVALAYLVLPVVLHGPTRRALPSTTRTNLLVWMQDHPSLVGAFPSHAVSLKPRVSDAISLACSTGLVVAQGGLLIRGSARRMPQGVSEEVRECFARVEWLARWFAQTSPAMSLFTYWGVKP
ncbi:MULTISPECIES: three component ABC system middle component [unclassified Nocardioides]|uniref:three component ABC system middle component n=1 Tax=unclassified Nocardioides TaxID=2615069 RepID=UPI0022854F67|nr:MULTISPECIES: three component ABC system middle component [unclassified Nocardioides]